VEVKVLVDQFDIASGSGHLKSIIELSVLYSFSFIFEKGPNINRFCRYFQIDSTPIVTNRKWHHIPLLHKYIAFNSNSKVCNVLFEI
jgi:hypothetical protein